MTIVNARLTSCQLTTKWRRIYFPLTAAEVWGVMVVVMDLACPPPGEGYSMLTGQAWVTCSSTVTPSVKVRCVHQKGA